MLVSTIMVSIKFRMVQLLLLLIARIRNIEKAKLFM
nr:MAG TPA: hypothetical protein [Caudoviricetes sp.]